MLRFFIGGFPALFGLLRAGDLGWHLALLGYSRVVEMIDVDHAPWHCQGVFATVLA